MKNTSPPSLWAGQWLHLFSLLILLPLTWGIWGHLGQPYPVIFWVGIAVPIVHQIYVWLAWRLELQTQFISKTIGFKSYLNLFFLFLISRPLSLFILGWMDMESLALPIVPRSMLTVFFTVPGIYTAYSIKKYFGFKRAGGADHFDPQYRSMPLVKGGIFKYTSNGMYLFGFFMLWAIAVGFNSSAALLVACYSHLSIWVHYYATEQPDMDYLYGS